VLGLAVMAFVSAWPDMEASVFDASTSLAADGKLQSLRCPWVISTNEVATVRARFKNSADRPASFLVRTRISRGFVTLVHQDSQQVRLEPNESRELSWPVAAEDAAYGRLVVGVSGISGQWLFAAGVFVGLALVGAGAGWWWSQRRPLGARDLATARRVGLLALIVVASLITGMLSWWLVSHLLLIASALFLFILLEQAFAA
jgi:hypothetical protein